MADPLNNPNLSAADPLEKWMSTFQVVYALTHESMNDLSSQDPGILRKESGDGLQVRKITAEMLKNNLQLAGEIHSLALNGHLGYAQDNGKVQFRQDIAEKIGTVRAFKVMTENPDVFEDMEVEIDAMDHDAYVSLHVLEKDVENEIEENEKELEKKQHAESEKIHHYSTPISPGRGAVALPKQNIAVRQIAGRMLEQLRTNEKNRQTHAAEVRESDKKRERDAIKDDVLKREILGTEIKASYQRADRNFGDAKESLTNASNRSTASIQEGNKAKESNKHKANPDEPKDVQRPSKKIKTDK